jgi:hypothetical protein
LIVRRACSFVINPLETPDKLPKALTDIISKTFTFVIALGNESYLNMQSRKYNVRGITVHPDLQRPPQQPLLIQGCTEHTTTTTIPIQADTSSQVAIDNQTTIRTKPSVSTLLNP